MHYDPMIAKLVVWGENRAVALLKLKDCLTKFQVCLILELQLLQIKAHFFQSSNAACTSLDVLVILRLMGQHGRKGAN